MFSGNLSTQVHGMSCVIRGIPKNNTSLSLKNRLKENCNIIIHHHAQAPYHKCPGNRFLEAYFIATPY